MEDDDIQNVNEYKSINIKLIKKGIIVFTTISVIAITGVFFYNDGHKNIDVWREVHWSYLLLGFIFIFNDLYLGGLRNHIFIKQFVPNISQMVSIRANVANIFMGAVTPSQSGGGPAQWYIFIRAGVPFSDVIGASFYNWISTLLFFPITGAIAIFILKDNVPDGFLMSLAQFGFSVFSTLFIVIMIGLFAPKTLNSFIIGLSKFVSFIAPKWSDSILKAGIKGVKTLSEYRDKYFVLIIRKPHLMLYSFLLTIVLYFNKYALAYVFILAFGQSVDFLNVIAVMAISYLLLYFSPSPGGSGIAEIGITALLIPIIGKELAPSITVLHRSFMVFIPAFIGAFVLINQIVKEKVN